MQAFVDMGCTSFLINPERGWNCCYEGWGSFCMQTTVVRIACIYNHTSHYMLRPSFVKEEVGGLYSWVV